MLSDSEIRNHMKHGLIKIMPFEDKNLGPNSYDMTLASRIKIPSTSWLSKNYTIRLKSADTPNYKEKKLPYTLDPGEFVLGMTNEIIGVKNCMGFAMPRSNITRLGLHIFNIPNVDPGFRGSLSAVMKNESPHGIEIAAGVRIFQVGFFPVKNVSTEYMDRALSKNTQQCIAEVATYKPDKEWR